LLRRSVCDFLFFHPRFGWPPGQEGFVRRVDQKRQEQRGCLCEFDTVFSFNPS
jgi:hypothetical protein